MDQKSGMSIQAYMFLIGFIFLYLAISFLGAAMELAVIVAGGIVGISYLLFNTNLIKKIQGFKVKPKKTEEFDDVPVFEKKQRQKVIEGEIVKEEVD